MDFSRVSRRNDSWVFEQIARVIEDAIKSGEIAPRQMLPSEQEIMHQARVSRWVVRRAIADLRDRGWVYTRPHLGSFASEHPPQ